MTSGCHRSYRSSSIKTDVHMVHENISKSTLLSWLYLEKINRMGYRPDKKCQKNNKKSEKLLFDLIFIVNNHDT